jgi:hypothetical protein
LVIRHALHQIATEGSLLFVQANCFWHQFLSLWMVRLGRVMRPLRASATLFLTVLLVALCGVNGICPTSFPGLLVLGVENRDQPQ